MKKLPTIAGLLIAASLKSQEAERKFALARRRSGCPREKHDAAEEAPRCQNEAARLTAMAQEDAEIITQLAATADFLRLSKHQSAFRTLALRKLEDAEMILRREIGDEPA